MEVPGRFRSVPVSSQLPSLSDCPLQGEILLIYLYLLQSTRTLCTAPFFLSFPSACPSCPFIAQARRRDGYFASAPSSKWKPCHGGSVEVTQTTRRIIMANLHSFVSQLKLFWFSSVRTLVPLWLRNHKLTIPVFKHPSWWSLSDRNSFWKHREHDFNHLFLQNILNICTAEKVILVPTLINKG